MCVCVLMLQYMSLINVLETVIIVSTSLGSVIVILFLLVVVVLRLMLKYKAQRADSPGQFRRRISSEQSTQYAYVDVEGRVAGANLTCNKGYASRRLSETGDSLYVIPDVIENSHAVRNEVPDPRYEEAKL